MEKPKKKLFCVEKNRKTLLLDCQCFANSQYFFYFVLLSPKNVEKLKALIQNKNKLLSNLI
jgi:hypothetical protein